MRMDREGARTSGRWLLGLFLLLAGLAHLTAQRAEFGAQVPRWLPMDAALVVVGSGAVEIVLGAALLLAGGGTPWVGVVVAAFFVAIFPGNVAQWTEGRDAFGLDSDAARFLRLWFQPLFVVWALWSTGGWRWLRNALGR